MSCLIVFRSITYAQNAQGLFAKNGILAIIIRPPLKLGKGSCSYALKLDGKHLKKACDLLLQTAAEQFQHDIDDLQRKEMFAIFFENSSVQMLFEKFSPADPQKKILRDVVLKKDLDVLYTAFQAFYKEQVRRQNSVRHRQKIRRILACIKRKMLHSEGNNAT